MEYKLIVAVSSFPSLYDPSCPTYRDLNTRSDSWRQVSQLVATSLASSQSSSQLSDQLTPPSPSAVQPDLQTSRNPPPQPPSRLHQLKTEEQQEVMEAELLDQTDGEEEEFHTAASPRPTRVWRRRRSTEESLLEEHLRRTEAREAQRERDAEKRDDVTLFLLSLAPAMRRLTAEKQSSVFKREMFSVVNKYLSQTAPLPGMKRSSISPPSSSCSQTQPAALCPHTSWFPPL
uniref:BESS domain-containing protein n=1 Tax=Labrus bergylta TaxID=56723 RepID=A0A3Q3MPF3_9LABR